MSAQKTEPTSSPGPIETRRATLTVGEVAVTLGVAPSTIWRWLRTLPGFPAPERFRVAGRNSTVWYADDVEAFRAANVDLAPRHIGNPLRLFEPQAEDAGNRGLYVAYLLDLSPFEVWGPLGPDPSPDGFNALFTYVDQRVAALEADAPQEKYNSRGYPADAELSGYLRTLKHCREVLEGRAAPEIRGPRGFANARGLRRGIYKTPKRA